MNELLAAAVVLLAVIAGELGVLTARAEAEVDLSGTEQLLNTVCERLDRRLQTTSGRRDADDLTLRGAFDHGWR